MNTFLTKRLLICWLLTGFCVAFFTSCSCNNTPDGKTDELKIPDQQLPDIQIKIRRYDQALFSLDQSKLQDELKRLQPEYYFFLEADLDDLENIRQMSDYLKDKQIKENYTDCVKTFPDLNSLNQDLSKAFSYYKFWFPDKKVPEVYTYVSGGDFDLPIKFADSVLIIALDMYLGKDYPYYVNFGLPGYKVKHFDKAYILRDCMEEVGIPVCSNDISDGTVLDQMISMGKLFYFLDVTLPETPDSIKIKYSAPALDWCVQNEGNVWSFLIDNKVLYSKDRDNLLKFFSDGPFTTSFGKHSPPRIGVWVGWQIVRAYMKEQKDMDIVKLLKENDSQKILKLSKYKPRKTT